MSMIAFKQNIIMRFGIKISNKAVAKFTLFIALIGAAFTLDIYFDKYPVKLDEINEEKEENADLQNIFYYNPSSSLSLKIPTQKISSRFHFEQLHNKFLQKYHKQHKYTEPDKEAKKIKYTRDLTHINLILKNYNFVYPDDNPPLSS